MAPLILACLFAPVYTRAEEHSSANQRKLETRQKTGDPIEVPMVFYDRTGFVRVVVNQKPLTFLVDKASVTTANRERVDLPIVRKTQIRTVTATVSKSSVGL